MKKKIINKDITNYYKTIIKVEVPFIIFIGFELSNENDLYNDGNSNKEENNINSEEKLNLICFNRMKDNIQLIKEKIVENFSVYNYKFSLKAIICSPFSGHYCGMLINLEQDENPLKKGKNYFYDDLKNDNNIFEKDDFNALLEQNIPYILIYSRED